MQITNAPTRTAPAGSAPGASASAAARKPVVIELRQAEKQANGYFRPEAWLKLLPALRASGLLVALPGEDLKNFLFLLSFLTPNGDCIAALPQLAVAMHVSAMKAQSRMRRLLDFRWQGEPLVLFQRAASGLDTYAVNSRLIAYEHTDAAAPEPATPPVRAAGRDAIIAHSRSRYARPRAEVERTIAELNGWPLPEEPLVPEEQPSAEEPLAPNEQFQRESESPAKQATAAAAGVEAGREDPKATASATHPRAVEPAVPTDACGATVSRQRAHVRQQLLRLGVAGETADELLSRFALVRIQRQLRWLRYRKAKNPAGLVVAAIDDDYEAPASLWHRARLPAEPAEDPPASSTALLPGEPPGPVGVPAPDAPFAPDSFPAQEEPPQAPPPDPAIYP